MKDTELQLLIDTLEGRDALSDADYDGVHHALVYALPDGSSNTLPEPQHLDTTDGAILVVDRAYPDWTIGIHGRANDKDGHWRCTLRQSDVRDNDLAIGVGRAPVLSRAILAAVLRLSATLKKL
ncbi:hypothetical protein KUH32_05015 [Thalassococcus sp. CAU 1522]|uniref:Uncharacterized protein n=1 Tax=Thalassococcus arenae TaxID=2851652 RepID=A0ABS6N5R1_9RHOB|nr:hypothetical protein [Thalassococcus arenae]MBV2359128.1 hypothetical protein [Thalassococcus arenae]